MANNSISNGGVAIAVSDMEKTREFYETVMEQKVIFDLDGYCVGFEGFTLQRDYAGLVAGGGVFSKDKTGVKLEIKRKSNNFQLGFEVENFDYWLSKIKSIEGIEILHDTIEYTWSQRAFRFYDYDKNIVEIGESIESLAKRFLSQGLTVEEVAKRIQHPIEFVQQFLNSE